LHDSIGYDIAMDAEISMILEMAQGLIGNAPKPDLQRRAVLYDRRDVARDALRDLADPWMPVFRHGRVDLHERIEMLEMNEALPMSARHRRIDLGDHATGDPQNRRREVDGNTKTDIASSIGWGHLEQRHIDGQPSARQEGGHVLQ